MSFSNYKNIGKVIQEFQVIYRESNFIVEVPFKIPNYFREDLKFVMQEGIVDNSEYAICENLIYPILKEVWKCYCQKFTLWSHQALTYDDNLSGFPEYILAQRSPLGKVVFDQPYFLLVEAKQDKFDEGWGQCLAEMVAAKRLNEVSKITVFGIVSNGKIWQFGKLESQHFIQQVIPYTIYNLDSLFAAVNYIFQQCKIQLDQLMVA
ncbi:MAG TPA: hypothetical protein DCF68_19645 [Cyanothece sp. UBA12306]|nr:hypothetical protein [Cyanothece sp. UBA12306]